MNIRAPSSHPASRPRPATAVFRGILAVSGMALLLAGCGARPNRATAIVAAPPVATPQAARIVDATGNDTHVSPASSGVSALLAAARTAYTARNVVAPAGHNAMEYYEAVLAQDPGNKVAGDALREIFPFAVPCVEQAIARHEFAEATREIGVLAKADPTNYSLTLLRSRLARQISGDVHVLTVTATADSWIQVAAANGTPIDARMLHAGESRTYRSAGPLRITLGNVAGISVTGDGRRLELDQHRPDQVAHLLLFVSDALARTAAHRTDGVRG